MLFEKHLFILLPFWIFAYENQLKEYEENEDKIKELTDDFRIIMMRLQEDCENGTIDEYTKCMIVDMSKKVVRNLLGNKFLRSKKRGRDYDDMKGQSHFPDFTLRLYYNTVYGYVKQSCLPAAHFNL